MSNYLDRLFDVVYCGVMEKETTLWRELRKVGRYFGCLILIGPLLPVNWAAQHVTNYTGRWIDRLLVIGFHPKDPWKKENRDAA